MNFGFQRLDGSNALHRSRVRGHFFGRSSFATHALATERNLVKVPADLPLELLAPLGCGLQTGAGTVMNSLQVSAGSSIAVFGTGAVGLAAVMSARFVGADPIVGETSYPNRLKLAMELGATHAIDNRREEIAARIADITGKGVDYVVETTGDAKMHRLAIKLLNPHGIVALLTGETATDSLPQGRKALGIIQGDAVPQRFIPTLIELHRAGKFPFERLVKFYDFKKIDQAMADARRGGTIKPVLRPVIHVSKGTSCMVTVSRLGPRQKEEEADPLYNYAIITEEGFKGIQGRQFAKLLEDETIGASEGCDFAHHGHPPDAFALKRLHNRLPLTFRHGDEETPARLRIVNDLFVPRGQALFKPDGPGHEFAVVSVQSRGDPPFVHVQVLPS